MIDRLRLVHVVKVRGRVGRFELRLGGVHGCRLKVGGLRLPVGIVGKNSYLGDCFGWI